MTVWQPGMRAVCVDDSPTFGRFVKSWFGLRRRFIFTGQQLVRGRVYTVTKVTEAYDIRLGVKGGSYAGLTLAEVPSVNPDGCFAAYRFRPLSETRLDQFRVHLAPTDNVPVDA